MRDLLAMRLPRFLMPSTFWCAECEREINTPYEAEPGRLRQMIEWHRLIVGECS